MSGEVLLILKQTFANSNQVTKKMVKPGMFTFLTGFKLYHMQFLNGILNFISFSPISKIPVNSVQILERFNFFF